MSDLTKLLEQVRAAEKGSEKFDRAIAAALNDPWSSDEEGQFGGYHIMPKRVRYTQSIDAAVALVGRVLPGSREANGQRWNRVCFSSVGSAANEPVGDCTAEHVTRPLAIVCALLMVLTRA